MKRIILVSLFSIGVLIANLAILNDKDDSVGIALNDLKGYAIAQDSEMTPLRYISFTTYNPFKVCCYVASYGTACVPYNCD